eukprot:6220751-Heterocapsa_arctica.AAC.1
MAGGGSEPGGKPLQSICLSQSNGHAWSWYVGTGGMYETIARMETTLRLKQCNATQRKQALAPP